MPAEYLNNKMFEKVILKFQSAKKEKTKYEMIVEDIRDTEQRTIKRKKCYQPDSWLLSLENYVSVNKNFEDSQKDLANALYILAENIVSYSKFNLVDPDDAIQETVIVCLEKTDKFDPSKGRAFNFFTTISINSLRQIYRTSKNYNELKKKYHTHQQAKNLENNGRTRKPLKRNI